jgi:hypothetical protein
MFYNKILLLYNNNKMCFNIVIYSFIAFFIAVISFQIYDNSGSGSIIEGLDTSTSGDDLGLTVGKYTTKIDALMKMVDSMQATVLGLLPTVAKNTADNAKNQQAIQAIIANKD